MSSLHGYRRARQADRKQPHLRRRKLLAHCQVVTSFVLVPMLRDLSLPVMLSPYVVQLLPRTRKTTLVEHHHIHRRKALRLLIQVSCQYLQANPSMRPLPSLVARSSTSLSPRRRRPLLVIMSSHMDHQACQWLVYLTTTLTLALQHVSDRSQFKVSVSFRRSTVLRSHNRAHLAIPPPDRQEQQ